MEPDSPERGAQDERRQAKPGGGGVDIDIHIIVISTLLLAGSIYLHLKSDWFWPQLVALLLVPQGRVVVHLKDLARSRGAFPTEYLVNTELVVLAAAGIFAVAFGA